MAITLSIVGGTYIEECIEPSHNEIFGSGLREAAALSSCCKIEYFSCIGKEDLVAAESICNVFGITSHFKLVDETVTFTYYHPLSKPQYYPANVDLSPIKMDKIIGDNILYYGLIEADVSVEGEYVVYDPQNGVSYKATHSKAKHLALVLNRKEAYELIGQETEKSASLNDIGKQLLLNEGADVVIIKDGSNGAWVFEQNQVNRVPIFASNIVFPIGSGDVFSAVFAYNWMQKKLPPFEAAIKASQYTAEYCCTKQLPLPINIEQKVALQLKSGINTIYLAGPFFTMSERWLINEFRNSLIDFGNIVFSPYHDAGIDGTVEEICKIDLSAIIDVEVILAVCDNLDPGTLFEIGYARAIGKRVIAFCERVSDIDKFMLEGSGCEIVSDFSTAVYKASW